MKAQDFRALVEQLGDLSQVQRDALVEALTAKGSGCQRHLQTDPGIDRSAT